MDRQKQEIKNSNRSLVCCSASAVSIQKPINFTLASCTLARYMLARYMLASYNASEKRASEQPAS